MIDGTIKKGYYICDLFIVDSVDVASRKAQDMNTDSQKIKNFATHRIKSQLNSQCARNVLVDILTGLSLKYNGFNFFGTYPFKLSLLNLSNTLKTDNSSRKFVWKRNQEPCLNNNIPKCCGKRV